MKLQCIGCSNGVCCEVARRSLDLVKLHSYRVADGFMYGFVIYKER